VKTKLAAHILLGSLAMLSLGQTVNHDSSAPDNHPQATTAAHEHDSHHAGPSGFKLEFENESVEVVRITIAPHEKLPMHDLTPRVIVLLTDQDLKITFPNGETREEHRKAGEAGWVSGQRHAGENLSDKPIEFIAVIPKQK
jgi:quercetin dioxygenase-like cupin family protein